MSLPFDRIVVTIGMKKSEFSLAEFFSLPLQKRIHYLLGGNLAFFLEDAEIEQREALAQLRTATILPIRTA
jgi:hypothetical protein